MAEHSDDRYEQRYQLRRDVDRFIDLAARLNAAAQNEVDAPVTDCKVVSELYRQAALARRRAGQCLLRLELDYDADPQADLA